MVAWFVTRVHLLRSNQTLTVIYSSSLGKILGCLHANQQDTDTGDLFILLFIYLFCQQLPRQVAIKAYKSEMKRKQEWNK